MQTDRVEEWRRLTALYGEMGDLEIRELASQINDLTETAQQVLRDEIKKRGIANQPSTASNPAPAAPGREASVSWEPASYKYEFSNIPEDNEPHEYTWKVPLCECETSNDAWRIAQMLKRAGIDSWIEAPEFQRAVGCSRILVGADQLEEAKVIAAQPISPDVLEQEKDLENVRHYEIPICPRCKAADPTLESVEPSNNWLCESCGYTWSDPVDDASRDGGSES